MIDIAAKPGESEWDRTERVIIEALTEGGWMTELQVRKATGLPASRVQNFTLAMFLEGKIKRRAGATITTGKQRGMSRTEYGAYAPGEPRKSLVKP